MWPHEVDVDSAVVVGALWPCWILAAVLLAPLWALGRLVRWMVD